MFKKVIFGLIFATNLALACATPQPSPAPNLVAETAAPKPKLKTICDLAEEQRGLVRALLVRDGETSASIKVFTCQMLASPDDDTGMFVLEMSGTNNQGEARHFLGMSVYQLVNGRWHMLGSKPRTILDLEGAQDDSVPNTTPEQTL